MIQGAEEPGAVAVRKLAPGDTEEMSFICAGALDVPDLATVLLIDLPEPEGWRCYAAFLEGREVACGAMLTIDGIAMLGLDGTRPEARRGGCQSALIHDPVVEEPAGHLQHERRRPGKWRMCRRMPFRGEMGGAPVEFRSMTAKEKLLREVLDLDEADAAAARIVIERRAKTDAELEAVLDEEASDEMDRAEQKAGFGPWKT